MRNKRLLVIWITILSLAIASVLTLAACGGSSETTSTSAASATTASTAATTGEKVLIRITTPVPAGDEFVAWAQEGFDRFNARTNGAYELKMFPGGELGPFPESLDAIRTGAIEGGMIPLAAFAGTIPEFGLVELPFLFNNTEANAYAMAGIQPIWDQLSQEKANQRTLGCMCVGTTNFFSAKKPLKTLDDMKGTIVGVDAPPVAALVQALGGSGIVVDFTEDYSNLQKGVIDAKTNAPQYILVAKLYEVAKYYTVFHGVGSLYAFTINSDVYNKMPKDLQDALAEELSATAKTISDNYVKKFYELQPQLEKLGVQYYFLPPEERDKWKALAYPGTLDALQKAGDIGAKVKQVVDEANAKFPYVAK
jgi:TRAP-type C4-dicarboxylate transport system substrate-binding protein